MDFEVTAAGQVKHKRPSAVISRKLRARSQARHTTLSGSQDEGTNIYIYIYMFRRRCSNHTLGYLLCSGKHLIRNGAAWRFTRRHVEKRTQSNRRRRGGRGDKLKHFIFWPASALITRRFGSPVSRLKRPDTALEGIIYITEDHPHTYLSNQIYVKSRSALRGKPSTPAT